MLCRPGEALAFRPSFAARLPAFRVSQRTLPAAHLTQALPQRLEVIKPNLVNLGMVTTQDDLVLVVTENAALELARYRHGLLEDYTVVMCLFVTERSSGGLMSFQTVTICAGWPRRFNSRTTSSEMRAFERQIARRRAPSPADQPARQCGPPMLPAPDPRHPWSPMRDKASRRASAFQVSRCGRCAFRTEDGWDASHAVQRRRQRFPCKRRHKKLCGSTSTSSLRLPFVLGAAASHCRR